MLKKILGLLAVLLMLSYIVFAIMTYSGKDSDVRCKRVVVVVKDSAKHQFVRAAEVRNILKSQHIKIVGKRLKDIDYASIEAAAASHKLISRAESFSTPSGMVFINVWQHVPVLRVMGESGDYYLNQDGKRTGLSLYSAADVIVATGCIKDSLTVSRLFKAAMLLKEDPFWDAQIEQIYVEPTREWILIPRVGDYEILFGVPEHMEAKLQRLRLFYRDALPKVGWERYSKINLKFENQIVCTIKE